VADNPWTLDADHLVGKDSIIGADDLRRTKAVVAEALARAYEYGFAQGRLAEIDRARVEVAIDGRGIDLD